MSGSAFLTFVAEKLKTNIDITSCAGVMVVKIKGETWTGITVDDCIEKIKQSYAIRYLENIQPETR